MFVVCIYYLQCDSHYRHCEIFSFHSLHLVNQTQVKACSTLPAEPNCNIFSSLILLFVLSISTRRTFWTLIRSMAPMINSPIHKYSLLETSNIRSCLFMQTSDGANDQPLAHDMPSLIDKAFSPRNTSIDRGISQWHFPLNGTELLTSFV